MKRRCIYLVAMLAGTVLAMAGCAKEAAPQDAAGAAQEGAFEDAAGAAQEGIVEDADGETRTEEAVVEAAPQVEITKLTKDWYNDDGSIWLVHGEYDTVSVYGNATEALTEGVKDWASQDEEAFLSYGDELSGYAAQDAAVESSYLSSLGSGEYAYSVFETLEVARSDSRVLSLLKMNSQYTGGAHGDYGYTGIVFDSQTGKLLALEDILQDAGGFQEKATAAILVRLEESYGDGLFPEYADTVEEMWENGPKWYLDVSGITFFFDPYEIGPYAMGVASVTLPYGEFAEYLKTEYLLPDSGGSVGRIPEGEEMSVSLVTERDSLDTLEVLAEYKDEYSDAEISLRVNEETMDIGTFARLGDAYFLRTEAGRSYVLLDTDYASDDYVTFVYEVTDGTVKETDRAEGVSLQDGNINTEKLRLSMHLDVLGSYKGFMDYALNDAGKLEQQQEIFEIPAETSPWGLLTVTKELPVTMDEGGQKTLSSGTSIRVIGSDNQGTIRFRVEGTEQEGSISYTRGNGTDDEWTLSIDGVPETEYFESIPYAG